MADLRERVLAVWRRTLSLSWPIAVQQTLVTLMRTVDIVVTGLFSPVAAIGLADLYAQIPLRVGLVAARSLQGTGDTRTPFYARLTGTFGFMLGFAYVAAVPLGYGLAGVYAGMVSSYAWWALVAAAGFVWGGWAERAAAVMAERSGFPD